MTSQRWQQIEQLYHAALERAPEERAAFLDAACDGDRTVRQEVESLLAYDASAQHFIATPPDAIAAELLTAEQAPSLIGSSLNHYQLLARLGRGGMGEVYLASDTRLGRRVAVKLLPAEFTRDAERVRRFEQEARAASALNHPNIITIHEIGQVEQHHFIVSEFVEGDTLRQRIQRGPLRLEAALEIVTQIASALAAAHRAGIVHRDIKPENVMLRPDGLVKVLDFGLAKLTETRGQPVDSQAATMAKLSTETGVVLGTVQYMSPEQARGQKVDQRTDIFSLGVMFYEMLAGRRPFEGATTSDVLVALLTAEPPPLRQHCVAATAELEQVVSKCLAKERAARYQTAEELLAELKQFRLGAQPEGATATAQFTLRRSFVLVAIVAVLVIGLTYLLSRLQAPTVQPNQIKALAVLPLENLSGDPQQEYFADGMTEALISNLTQVRALRVISRTSVMRFKGSRKSLQEIARELNVDAVIEGSVQRAGDRVKITARLIRVAHEAPLWSDEHERELSDVLKLQSEVARVVADKIRVQVTAEERARLSAARSVNPQAHDAYLLGRHHFNKGNQEGWKQAIDYFERAVERAPDYAAAYAGLSDAWLQRGIFVANFKEVEAPARAAALQAIKLDEQIAEAHSSLANIKHYYDWDWAGAEAAFRRALELDPGGLDAHIQYGHLLMHLGRHDEAIREGQLAVQLDPVSSAGQSALGRFLYRARRYEEALPHLKRAVELEPRSVAANIRLSQDYAELGRYDEALAVYEQNRELLSNDGRQAQIAYIYALMGKGREARQMIRSVKATPFLAASVYAALGDKDEAFRILEKAVAERSTFLVALKEDPPFEHLHADPRWKKLLRRMNFLEEVSGK